MGSRAELYREQTLAEGAAGCLLCSPAPCRAACPYDVPVDDVLRSLRFENPLGASNRLPGGAPCAQCVDKPCLKACLKGRMNAPVPIDRLLSLAATGQRVLPLGVDLSIDFCGVHCENPFFLSSSVVGSNYDMVARAFRMGWAGVAWKTIGAFVPDEVSPRFDALCKEALPFVGFKNIEQISEQPLQANLEYLHRLKADFPTKVLIASIMGRHEDEWTLLARAVTEAGADIIECNFSCPHMAADGLGSDVGQNPDLVAAYTHATKRGTHLPILAKMTPNIGNMEPPAIAAMQAGASGIAAINTIKSVMNVDMDSFASGPDVLGKTSVGGYSGKAVKPIALRFIQAMKADPRLREAPISGMGGIETWRDAAEFIAMGCASIQVTTAVMQYGYRIIEDMIEGMALYLSTHGMRSVSELVGRALPHIIEADRLDRGSICYPKFDRARCLGCGRCTVSCADGGHQALRQRPGGPALEARKCVGCHLCVVVCPVGAIVAGPREKKKITGATPSAAAL